MLTIWQKFTDNFRTFSCSLRRSRNCFPAGLSFQMVRHTGCRIITQALANHRAPAAVRIGLRYLHSLSSSFLRILTAFLCCSSCAGVHQQLHFFTIFTPFEKISWFGVNYLLFRLIEVNVMKVKLTKKTGLKSNAENTENPNQPSHVRNQNDGHNVKKVALGPNTRR